MIVCSQCGGSATYILTQGLTITACSSCSQATVMESNIVIRIPREKYAGFEPIKSEMLLLALVAKALFDNWSTVAQRTTSM